MVGGHLNLRSWENKDGKKYNIVNITADVAALSLEFNKANNHEARTNGTNRYKSRPERINNGEGSDKTDSGESRLGSANSINEMDGTNNSNGPDRTNSNENTSDRANSIITDLDKMDSGGSRQYGKNKKKEPEKKQGNALTAQDLAADYSLEVIGK